MRRFHCRVNVNSENKTPRSDARRPRTLLGLGRGSLVLPEAPPSSADPVLPCDIITGNGWNGARLSKCVQDNGTDILQVFACEAILQVLECGLNHETVEMVDQAWLGPPTTFILTVGTQSQHHRQHGVSSLPESPNDIHGKSLTRACTPLPFRRRVEAPATAGQASVGPASEASGSNTWRTACCTLINGTEALACAACGAGSPLQ